MVKNYTEVRGESTAPGSVLSPETLERLRALQERALQAAMVGAGREAVAERIVDEMARRQGHRLGPFFDWSRVTKTSGCGLTLPSRQSHLSRRSRSLCGSLSMHGRPGCSRSDSIRSTPTASPSRRSRGMDFGPPISPTPRNFCRASRRTRRSRRCPVKWTPGRLDVTHCGAI